MSEVDHRHCLKTCPCNRCVKYREREVLARRERAAKARAFSRAPLPEKIESILQESFGHVSGSIWISKIAADIAAIVEKDKSK